MSKVRDQKSMMEAASALLAARDTLIKLKESSAIARQVFEDAESRFTNHFNYNERTAIVIGNVVLTLPTRWSELSKGEKVEYFLI